MTAKPTLTLINIGDDDDPPNLDKIGHLNVSGALHPVALADAMTFVNAVITGPVPAAVVPR